MAAPSGFVATPTGRIYYERTGRGTPVVWLHPSFLDRRIWDPEVTRLAGSYEHIRFDRPGFGRSDPPAGEHVDAEDLERLLDGVSVPSAYFVGLSEGGRIALDFAVTHPDRVDGLVAIGASVSGYDTSDPREEAMWMDLARREQEIGRLAESGETGPALEALVDLWAPALDRATRKWVLAIAADNVGPAFGTFDAFQRAMAPPAIGRIGTLPAPVLVLTGSKDFPGLERVAQALANGLPNAQWSSVEGADHLLPLSRREAFEGLLDGFLARLDLMLQRRGSTR